MPESSDSQRVRRAMNGDGDAFSELVGRYRDAVYGVCYHRVRHPEEAKDLAQEAFVRAYLDLSQLRDPAAFPAWLRRVAERTCATWQRRQRLWVTALETEPEPAVERDLELPVAVRGALDRLSDEARLAVTLYYINGYSTREVADFLGVPDGTVKSRLYHARRRLKGDLMDDYRDALRESVPGPEFEGAVVRAVRSLEEAQSLPQAQRYGGPRSEEELGRYLVLEKDGSLLGESWFSTEELFLRGVRVRVARQGHTTGEGDWREIGFHVLDRLVTSANAQFAEDGFGLAAWHGELLCGTRDGYVPCFYHHRVQAPAANLAWGQAAGTVRSYQPCDAEAVAALRALPRARPIMWAWQGPEDEPPFVLERDGKVVGCYSLAWEHRTNPPALVNEVEGVDMTAYQTLAKHIAETALADGVDTVSTYLSPDHPLGALMLARGGICQTQGASWEVAKDEEMVCILDLAAALQAVAPGLGGPARGRVIIEMDGEVATTAAGDPSTHSAGSGQAPLRAGPPEIEAGAPARAARSRIGRVPMTQLLVGYRSVFEITGRPDVGIRDQDFAILDTLFPKTRPYAWPDPYIWDEQCLRDSHPWAFEEPMRTKLLAHPRPWA